VRIPLQLSISATFKDNGFGGTIATAVTGPSVYGSKWNVTKIRTITNSTQTLGASSLQIYRGTITQSNTFDNTDNADNDTDTCDESFIAGDFLTFVWTNGDIGSVATAVISGTIETGR
jgi:hypothetical protein